MTGFKKGFKTENQRRAIVARHCRGAVEYLLWHHQRLASLSRLPPVSKFGCIELIFVNPISALLQRTPYPVDSDSRCKLYKVNVDVEYKAKQSVDSHKHSTGSVYHCHPSRYHSTVCVLGSAG